MNNHSGINIKLLDKIITGRVEPQIYAFTTETIPNYLKVGDTYRPIETRLNEWRKYFPNLEKKFEGVAKVDEENFFRDYAIHCYLETEAQKARLKQDTLDNIPYYSNEFFKEATAADIEDAISDIKNSFTANSSKYQYYQFEESRIPITHTYKRTEDYDPRPNQDETIKRFKEAREKDRTSLLMYAVMRFGKSFTSMCCAVEMDAQVVLVVSAKADVKDEWKKTVESHIKFDGFSFVDSESLSRNENIIEEKLKSGEKVALFLTLQDLQGDEIKSKHKKAVFERQIDLLIIDETHFGARAVEYGKALRNFSAKEVKNELKLNDDTIEDLESSTKAINAKVRLHLSGTPYRILMNSEFEKEDIIAFYQFSNIANDQEKWLTENFDKPEEKQEEEWGNPYYGFPQMIRFAFNPNKASRKKMEQLKESGVAYAFSELLKPQSVTKDTEGQLHKKFKYEVEIMDLLKVIDGSEKDDSLLGFLDYDKLKNGKMCRHIVCVLPYRASCDALEELINSNQFKNLSSYEVINISGVEDERVYKDTQSVQEKIKKSETEDKKTITLTVNRMLTGSTVPEWDTMLFLKDTASPQEYDQAVFRLQNQYIKVFKEPNGDTVKYNMKPQTLLVDFNPNRMFQMQEHKSQIYNVNTESNGNNKLEERIKRELEISPIIVLNENKMVQVTPSDVLDAVREYSSKRSVHDEATSIGIDYSLLEIETVKAEIEKQNPINSNKGLEIKASEGEGGDIDVDDVLEKESDPSKDDDKEVDSTTDEVENDYKGQFAMYYARILFFAFLTNTEVRSLQKIIDDINNSTQGLRVANNLGIDKEVLSIFQKHLYPFILRDLDYKIQNINSLANDKSLSPVEKAQNAIKKFSRLSDSEVVTPEEVADRIIAAIPEDEINNSTKFLDIASKQGEFVYAVYKEFGKEIANNFYSIPTSKIAYEFTRKLYSLLDLDIDKIEANYTSYDLIKGSQFIKNDKLKINNTFMKFDVIVGNPPYQENIKGNSRDKPVYNKFMDMSYMLSEQVVLITPARFLFNVGQTPKDWNSKMLNDPYLEVVAFERKTSNIFPNTDIPGGVAITVRNMYKKSGPIKNFIPYSQLGSIIEKLEVTGFVSLNTIHYGRSSHKLNKNIYVDNPSLLNRIKNSEKKSVGSNIFDKLPEVFVDEPASDNDKYIKVYGRQNNARKFKYLKSSYIEKHENLHRWKILIPKSRGVSALGESGKTLVIGEPVIGEPGLAYTQTFISLGSFSSRREAENLKKYVQSKFCRVLIGAKKVTQDNAIKAIWYHPPLQDFTLQSDIDWDRSIEKIDEQLFKKYKLSPEEEEFIEKMIKPMD